MAKTLSLKINVSKINVFLGAKGNNFTLKKKET